MHISILPETMSVGGSTCSLANKEADMASTRRISPDIIQENPENPRVIYKAKEIQQLLESIDESGIILPLTVYPDDGKFTLLDGARRLRCARRLNLKDVPVNIIAKPTRVQNILQMFHIHNVRQAWELIETAKKLDVLLKDEAFKGKSVKEIARLTGLTESTVNRCRDLLSLDQRHQDMIMDTYRKYESGEELDDKTKLTEDFFIESRRAISSIRRFVKDVSQVYDEKALLDKFIEKRRLGTFSNVVEIGRTIPKIIAAGRKGASQEKVTAVVKRLIEEPKFTIQQAYEIAAGPILASVDVEKRCTGLIEELIQLRQFGKRDLQARKEGLVRILKELRKSIDETLSRIE